MPYQRNYTQEQKQEIYQHYLECGKVSVTAKAFGTTVITVTAVIKSFGKTPNQLRKERTAKRNQEIWQRLARQESYQEVANEFGLSQASLSVIVSNAETKLVRSTVQPETLKIIEILQTTDLTYFQISEVLGVSYQRVINVNNKYNVRQKPAEVEQ